MAKIQYQWAFVLCWKQHQNVAKLNVFPIQNWPTNININMMYFINSIAECFFLFRQFLSWPFCIMQSIIQYWFLLDLSSNPIYYIRKHRTYDKITLYDLRFKLTSAIKPIETPLFSLIPNRHKFSKCRE